MATIITGLGGPSGELEARQRALIADQWPDGLPTEGATSYTVDGGPSSVGWTGGAETINFSKDGKSDELTFEVYPGLTLIGYLFHPLPFPRIGGLVRDAWVINLTGHETGVDGYHRCKWFVDRGFRTINLAMPGYLPNPSTWVYNHSTLGDQTITINHNDLTLLENDGVKTLPLFLNQVFMAANWIREQDGRNTMIHLAGHSGGGWATSFLAAIDKYKFFEVKFSHAGEMPHNLPVYQLGDFEQRPARPFYLGHNWTWLYPIGSRYGKFIKSHGVEDIILTGGGRERSLELIQNWVNTQVADYPGSFEVQIDDPGTPGHFFSDTALESFTDEIIPLETNTTPTRPTNVALSANGGTATASTTANTGGYYSASYAINGTRHTNNAWDFESVWQDSGTGYPDWLQVDFDDTYDIEEVNVYSLRDSVNYIDDPDLGSTGASNVIRDFKLQAWISGAWADQATIENNNKIRRQILLSPAVTTDKIRVYITQGGVDDRSRIVEVEALTEPSGDVAPPFDPYESALLVFGIEADHFMDYGVDGTSIANLTQWTDGSGNNFHGTVNTDAGGIVVKHDRLNGHSTLQFTGTDNDASIGFASLSHLTEGGEIFIVWKLTDLTLAGANQMGSDPYMYYPANDNLIYDDFGSTAKKSGLTPAISIDDTWHLYNAYSAPNDWGLYQNTSLVHQTGTNTVGFTTTPKIGNNGPGGAAIVGEIACAFLFATKLDSEYSKPGMLTWLSDNGYM